MPVCFGRSISISLFSLCPDRGKKTKEKNYFCLLFSYKWDYDIRYMIKLTRKITSSGKYSKVIVIPREFLKALGWRQNQNLELELDEKGKRIIVKDSKEK